MPKTLHMSKEICLYVTFSDYRWLTCVYMPRKLFAFVDKTASVACVIKYPPPIHVSRKAMSSFFVRDVDILLVIVCC